MQNDKNLCINLLPCDIHSALPRRLLEEPCEELRLQESQFVCNLVDGFLWGEHPVVCEIVVGHPFKMSQNILVHLSASDEMPLIEIQAVIQQCFDVDGNEALAVPVGGRFQLILHLLKSVIWVDKSVIRLSRK